MSRGPQKQRFTKKELGTALEAAQAAGLTVSGFEIDADGKIKVTIGNAPEQSDSVDREMAEFEERHYGRN